MVQLQPRKELSVAEAAVKDALRIFRESPGDIRVPRGGPYPSGRKNPGIVAVWRAENGGSGFGS